MVLISSSNYGATTPGPEFSLHALTWVDGQPSLLHVHLLSAVHSIHVMCHGGSPNEESPSASSRTALLKGVRRIAIFDGLLNCGYFSLAPAQDGNSSAHAASENLYKGQDSGKPCIHIKNTFASLQQSARTR